MKQIPLDAQVHCSDGQVGTSTHIIYDPSSKKVTHFVVGDNEPVTPKHFLVPIELVAQAGHDSISLNCTKEELTRQESFVETRYIESPGATSGYPADSVYMEPYVSPLDLNYVPVEVERIPVGELALHRGAVVEAQDGYVGHLGELLLDPDSGAITHLVLQEGHAWGKKEVAVPVSAVEQALENTILLKLDKAAVEKLPAIPVKRDYGRPEEGRAMELLAKLFDDEEQAGEMLKQVKKMSAQEGASFKVRDAAVLVKD
jgi:sporulation protein YlmC with PRC-barrel domain